MENIEKYKSLEDAAISIRTAELADVPGIKNFLKRPEIDSLFVPPLSDKARGMTIEERVEKKIREGIWVIATKDKKIVGCMAVVPAKLTREVPSPKKEGLISKGVSIEDWKKNKIWELSTVVVDQELSKKEKIKGIGKSLLEMAKNWVRNKEMQGLITDSWVGGDMGGFVRAMNVKEYRSHNENGREEIPNTLIRIYTDPAKRGEKGPPTVIYSIPLDNEDWRFLKSKQVEIKSLQGEYNHLEESLH